jgi:multidrug efflux pump subunit AcrB
MWIVRLALRRPFTVASLSFGVLLLGILSVARTRADIFPTIDVPIVFVVWSYPGMPAEDMERRIVSVSERSISTTVDGIARLESRSLSGVGLLKVTFEEGADIPGAIAQITAQCQTATRLMPPGTTPALVIRYNVSNLPVAQLTVSSATLPEQQLYDYGFNFLRLRLFTVPGLSVPPPYGGKQRQIMVDIDPRAASAYGLAPQDIVSSILSSNVITPAGAARMGEMEYDVTINNSPTTVEAFRDMPLKAANGATVVVGDVAKVTDSFAVQRNIVRVDGKRASYLVVVKKANASTIAIVDAARELLPVLKKTAPNGIELSLDFDQSTFVRAAVSSVVREAVFSSALVSFMIWVFLGSWRSVVIVCTSIPLSIMASLLGLYLTGNTINIMTMGGLSLAIGMLVDDATVEVENIHRNQAMGKGITVAILDGARQVATPALAATSTICIVFLPLFFLSGATRSLFVPLAYAVIFAMSASYVLSRTLVPALARKLMANAHAAPAADWRDRFFLGVQTIYERMLLVVLHHRAIATGVVVALLGVSVGVGCNVGTDFFPGVDAGQMRLHVRAAPGTRIESTEQLVGRIEATIRHVVPGGDLQSITDNIGVPSPVNLAFAPTDNVGEADADVLVALKPHHASTVTHRRKIRAALETEFPGVQTYFQPADIVAQVLNFGLAAPIDIQIEGKDVDASMDLARKLRRRLQAIPGVVDVHIPQINEHPALHVDVDRIRGAQIGVTQRDVASNLLTSLSSSTMVSPSFWVNPQSGVQYVVAVQTPLEAAKSVDDLYGTPLSAPTGESAAAPGAARGLAQYLGSVARIDVSQSRSMVTHDRVQRTVNLLVGIEDRDLGGVATDIDAALKEVGELPPGQKLTIRGQSEAMITSFKSLAWGLTLAITLVYGLMLILYQSWIDPFVIVAAVPGALAGVVWALAATGSTLNIESLMGAIMAVGVATSNSILLVNFANDVRATQGLDAMQAAIAAARTRVRPVLMTGAAMVFGMIPASLGLGEGGEQNAPLARAVVGGLSVATVMTLFFVPLAYATLRTRAFTKHDLDRRFAIEARGAEADPS